MAHTILKQKRNDKKLTLVLNKTYAIPFPRLEFGSLITRIASTSPSDPLEPQNSW